MAATGSGSATADLRPGDHVCCLYRTGTEHEAWLKALLRHAEEAEQRVLFLTQAAETDSTLAGELSSYVHRGRLSVVNWAETQRQGAFAPEAMAALLEREASQTRAAGYTALLAVGGMDWLAESAGGCQSLLEYETCLNELLPRLGSDPPVLAVCLYDRRLWPGRTLIEAMDYHPRVAVGEKLYDNACFLPSVPAEAGDGDPYAARFEGRIRHLRRSPVQGGAGQARKKQETGEKERPRYRDLVEESPVGIWHFTADRRSLYANPTLCSMFEVEASQEIDEDEARFHFPPESREIFDLELTKWAAGLTSSCEVEILGKRGGDRNVLVSGVPILSPEGEVESFIAAFLDVTGSRYRLLAESATDLMSKHTPAGTILYASPAFREVLGYDPTELLGHSVFDFFHPEELENGRQVMAAILEKPFSYRFRHHNGDYVWMESACKAVRDSRSGEVKHVLVVSRDISERKMVEEIEAKLQKATRDAASDWRSTFDSIESPLLLVDRQGRIQRMNRAAMELSGRDYSENLGRALAEVHDAEPWQSASELVGQVTADGSPTSTQLILPTPEKVWEISARPRIRPTGGEERIILILRDVTEQAALQESLRRSELMSAMGSLVAGVAHEVRNPLFAISSTVDAFEARFGSQDSFRPFLEVLRGEVKRMTELMNELLEYGKSATINELLPGSLEKVLEESVRLCSALAREGGVDLRLVLEEGLPLVVMDRSQLPHVFRNLLDNAIRESPHGAQVVLRVHRARQDDESWIECSVEDSGSGFKPEDLSKVCEPFFSRRRGGTGLGLSIVQRVVEAHGGEMSLGNRPEGGGAVLVRLPLPEGKA